MKVLVVFLLGLGVLAVLQVASAQQQSSHEGTVVSAGNGKLDMKSDDGKEHSHSIDGTVQIMVHGKPGKLEDLTKGTRILVVTDSMGKVMSISTVDHKKYKE